MKFFLQNTLEFFAIAAVWWILLTLLDGNQQNDIVMSVTIVAVSLLKAGYFGLENLQQLWKATRDNLPYHRFMLLMLVNMAQIAISYGLDYHCLYSVQADSFAGIQVGMSWSETVFEFIYFSVLNFTFFGYGDITPQTIPAKLITMSEIVLAFTTVIFILSDFISLKESLFRSLRPTDDSGASKP